MTDMICTTCGRAGIHWVGPLGRLTHTYCPWCKTEGIPPSQETEEDGTGEGEKIRSCFTGLPRSKRSAPLQARKEKGRVMDKLCPYRKRVDTIEFGGPYEQREATHTEEAFLPCYGEECMMFRKGMPNEIAALCIGPIIEDHCALAGKL